MARAETTLYLYVGPPEVAARAAGRPKGVGIDTSADLARWAGDTAQQADRAGLIAATFVIEAGGRLLVADRRSEHVACAGGGPVRSAGELFLSLSGGRALIVEASNQSTGFCPEPESWPAVAAALDRAGVRHPGRFTQEITFRRCVACGQRNLVKDHWFVCGVCGASLPAEWNF